jgi:autotransporter-associated beta strand protein
MVLAWHSVATAGDGTWTNSVDGLWSNPANWMGGMASDVADGANSTANFNTLDIVNQGAPFYRVGVGLDGNRTIGHMIFGDTNTGTPGAWEVYDSGAPILTLAGTTPSITVGPLGPIDTGTPPIIDDAIIRPDIAGTAGLTKLGSGILTIASSSTNTITGGINVGGGTLRLQSALATQEQAVTLANGTTIESFGPLRSVTVAAGGTATVRLTSAPNGFGGILPTGPGATLNFRIASTGQVEVQRDWAGFQNMNLIGEGATPTPLRGQINTNTGANNVFNGNSFATTNLHLDNVNLFIRTNSQGNTIPIAQLTGTSTAVLSGGNSGTAVRWEVGSANTNSTFSGQLNGAGGLSLNKVGTATLTLAGTFSATSPAINNTPARQGGVFRVTAGTMRFTGVNSIPGGPAATPTILTTIDVLSGATFDVSGSAGGTFTTQSQQKIQGSGTILGNWIHAGGTVPGRIQAGDVGAPTAANEGNMSSGVTPTAGTLTFNGNLELSGGHIVHDMSPTPASGNDLVQVTGVTTLTSGRIIPNFLNGVPDPGLTYTVLNSTGGFSGSASNLIVDVPGRGADVTPFTSGNNLQFTTPAGGITTADLLWTGQVSGSNNSAWDVETTQNWTNAGNPDRFFNFDDVTFPDAAPNKTVTVAGVVTPTSMEINSASAYSFTGGGSITGTTGLTKTGAGALTMQMANTFTGPASITDTAVNIGGTTGLGAGPLTLSNSSLTATVSVNNSSLDIPAGTTNTIQLDGGGGTGGTANIPTMTGDGTLNLTSTVADKFFGTFTTTGFTGTLNVAPTAPATQLGQVRIRAGQTSFDSAVVNLSNVGVSNQQGGGGGTTVTVGFGELHGNATTSLIAFNGGSATFPNIEWQIGALDTNSDFAGTIVDGGGAISSVTKVGTGTLTLTGANTYTGDTAVEAGTLSISSAYLANAADVLLSTGALLNLNFAGSPDVIDSLFIDGISQAVGIWGAVGSGAQFESALLTGTGTLQISTFVPPPILAGDYNDDGVVDAADYVIWRKAEGTMTVLPNDPIGGTIGLAHFNQWRGNFGATGAGSGSSSSGSVPEPATWALVGICFAFGCCWRRR